MVARYEYDDYGRVVHMWGADGQEVREARGRSRGLRCPLCH